MPAAATDATAVVPAASAHPVMPASTQDRENPIPCMMTPFMPASSQALRPAEPDRQHLLHAAAQLQVAPAAGSGHRLGPPRRQRPAGAFPWASPQRGDIALRLDGDG